MSMYHYFTFITRESNCNRKGENMKKQLVVDLDDKPQNLEEFIQCIEEYLKKTAGFPASLLYKLSGVELSRFEGGSQ